MSAGVELLSNREIEEQVIALVARARNRYLLPERYRAETAREAIGLRLVRGPLPRGTDGALRGNTIVISTEIEWASRFEFTVFHEILHYLLEEDEDAELIEYFTKVHRNDPSAYDRAIEQCCHVGAAEFMIPRAQAQALIAEQGFSVDLLEPLTNLNGASLLAAAVQLAVLAPIDCYVLVCAHGLSPAWPHNTCLYVEQATRREGAQFPVARGTAIPPDHLFHQVWTSKRTASGPSYIPFRSGKTYPCEHAEAKKFRERVVGILYMGHPPRKEQLGLNLPL